MYQVGNQESLYFVWPSRIVHSAGLSICENASYVRPFLKNWQFYLGFLRFDFSVDNSHPFRVRFLPEAPYAIYMASQYGNFNISKTIQTGSIIFQNRDTLFAVNRSYTPSGLWAGASFGRALTVGRDWGETNFIIAHEIIHEFQFNEYQIFNSFLSRPAKKITGEKTQKIFTKYDFEMIDYFRPKIWNNQKIERWYRQNLFLVVRNGHSLSTGKSMPALSLIHPELFNTVIEQQTQKIKQLQSSIEKLKKRDVVGKVAKLFKK
jgi:hypothetical protein